MPPVRGHSREGPVVERLVAPCALCGCIPPLWFPRPTFVRIPVAGRKLPSPFHPRPSVKGRRRSALSIPWLCPGPRCPHARTAALRLASCHVAASRSRHASAVTWPPTRPSALLFSFPTLHPLLHRAPALPIDGRRAGLLFLCAAYVQLYVYARTYTSICHRRQACTAPAPMAEHRWCIYVPLCTYVYTLIPPQAALHRARADGQECRWCICTTVCICIVRVCTLSYTASPASRRARADDGARSAGYCMYMYCCTYAMYALPLSRSGRPLRLVAARICLVPGSALRAQSLRLAHARAPALPAVWVLRAERRRARCRVRTPRILLRALGRRCGHYWCRMSSAPQPAGTAAPSIIRE